MNGKVYVLATLALFCTVPGWCQEPDGGGQPAPIYRVTVVERTIQAVNYQYRRGPTDIDFRGTVLMPKAKGRATVESKRGRTRIDARFDHIDAPTRYGTEYLTYVLWAITPEGRPKNLGEIVVDSDDDARLEVTTDLQAFGLLVSAEPYAAVRAPSDVVVMENKVRPDTRGLAEPIAAKVELMPRGHYTYDVSMGAAVTPRPEVPYDRYEEILQVYEAQNAVQIAKAAGADRYAPESFHQADYWLKRAKDLQIRRAEKSAIITAARRSAQSAEDARAIAERRKHDEQLAAAQDRASHERELRLQAEADARRAKAQSSADRMELEDARAARERAEAEAAAAAAATAAPPPPPVTLSSPSPDTARSDLRSRLLREFGAALPSLDSPRGLVVTLSDDRFHGAELNSRAYEGLGRVAGIVAAHPGLYVQVEGYAADTGREAEEMRISRERAETVRNALVHAGLPVRVVSARGYGDDRPLASNATASGREQNRRVEIVITGDPIGSTPHWDSAYVLTPRR